MTLNKAQKMVDAYADAHLAAKEAKKTLDENRDSLIAFLSKYECPDKGRFVIDLCEEEKCALSWKDYAEELAEKLYGDDAAERIAKAKKLAGTSTVQKLLVNPNPRWKK